METKAMEKKSQVPSHIQLGAALLALIKAEVAAAMLDVRRQLQAGLRRWNGKTK
jgi:hypothetical protein